MAVTNPLRLIHAAIWQMLEDEATFTPLVQAGNRVKYTKTDRFPESGRETLSNSQTPEVRVSARGLLPHLDRTSNGASLTVRWSIEVPSGDQRFETLFEVEWAILKAMSKWRTRLAALGTAATWYVVKSRPLPVKTDLGDPQLDRTATGWSSVWMAETEIWCKTSFLQA